MVHLDGEFGIQQKDKNIYYFIFITIMLIFFFVSHSFLTMAETNVSSFPSSFQITVSFDEPLFSQIKQDGTNYSVIMLSGCHYLSDIGSPKLPSKTVHILLPYKTQFLDATILSRKTQNLSYKLHDTPIYPIQSETPFSMMLSNDHFDKDETLYGANERFPRDSLSVGSVDYFSGFPVISLVIHPFEYHPSNHHLFFSNEIQLELIVEPCSCSSVNALFRGIEADKTRVSNLVVNPETLTTYPSTDELLDDSNETGLQNEEKTQVLPFGESNHTGLCNPVETNEYVIVTNAYLTDGHNFSYNWSDLITHREQHDGLSGKIVTMEEIVACESYWNNTDRFNDSAALLREFIKDAYLNWETEYVLLGGSWQINNESRQIVPCRIFTDCNQKNHYDTMPSDLYFSNLDGDWYDEEKEVWGGGNYSSANDKYSELSVGRIPVWTPDHVSNIVGKIIWYDECTDTDWLRSVAFLGGDLGWTSTSKQYLEEIRLGNGSFSEYKGFEEWNTDSLGFELDTSHRYYDADYPTEADAVNAWNRAIDDNNFSLINHLSHGSVSKTLDLGYGTDLTNDHFFFAISQACLSGRYSSSTSGATTFTSSKNDNGAFAMVLNTGYGYGNSLTTAGKSQEQVKIFWDYFFNEQALEVENWRLGPAMRHLIDTWSAKIDTENHVNAYVWYSLNFFGDPAQRLRINVEVNTPPLITMVNPVNQSSNVHMDLSKLFVEITDVDDDLVNWTIETSPDIGSSSGFNDTMGTKNCGISELRHNTTYTWFVNVSDGSSWINETFDFTTRSLFLPEAPKNFTIESSNRTQLYLSWNHPSSSDKTYIERKMVSNWDRGEGIVVFNDTSTYMIDTNLSTDTTYYYQAWGWNDTDQLYSSDYSVVHQNTLPNHSPDIFVQPENNSKDQPCSFSFFITISDKDADQLTWNITSSNGIENSSTTLNTTATLDLTDLLFNTTYTIWINVTDGYSTIQHWYQFSTRSEHIPPRVTGFFIESMNRTINRLFWDAPSNNHVVLEYNTSSFWDRGDGHLLYDGTSDSFFDHEGLQRNTTYYYQIWQYNTTYKSYSESVQGIGKTPYNMVPVLFNETPSNQSTIKDLTCRWSIDILDKDNDFINWSIHSSSGEQINETNQTCGTKTIQLIDLPFETMISVWVNVSDGYDEITRMYTFFTQNKPKKPSSTYPSQAGGSALMSTNSFPVADAGDNITGFVNETIFFSAKKSKDADDDFLQFRWDFTGDGDWDTDWSSSPYANVSYDRIGIYLAIVEATDGTLRSSDSVFVQIIQGNHPPELLFVDVEEQIFLSERFFYNVSIVDRDGDDVRYRIDYGDGTLSDWSTFQQPNTSLPLSHVYHDAGTFHVRVILEDDNEAQTGWIPIGIVEATPLIDSVLQSKTTILEDQIIALNDTIIFHAYEDGFISSEEIVQKINWYVQDTLIGHGEEVAFTFTRSGFFNVTCEYENSEKMILYCTQTIEVQESESSLSLTQSITFFVGSVVFCGIVGIGLFVIKRKKQYNAIEHPHFTVLKKSTEIDSNETYDGVSQQVDKIIER